MAKTTFCSEHSEQKGNFKSIARQIVDKLPSKTTKVSYNYDSYMFHIMSDKGIIYLCMSEKDFGNRLAFNFMEDIKERFEAQYGTGGEKMKSSSAELVLQRDFGSILKTQMDFFSNNPEADKVKLVKHKIEETKNIMVDNIEKVLDRGEKIELLVDKTDELEETAQDFRFKSRNLARTMWFRNVKLIILLVVLVLIIAFVVLWLACGIFPPFGNCISLVASIFNSGKK